jgi:hypothetical protein
MIVLLEFVNGLQFGVEHISGEEDDEYHYAVVLNFTVLRLVFMKMKQEG